MSEERPRKRRLLLDRFELFSDALLRAFAFSKRIARHACSFGVTPHQFIGVEVGRVAGRK